MSIGVNINGTNKEMDKGYVNVDGSWKNIDKVFCKVNCNWRQAFSGIGIPKLVYTTPVIEQWNEGRYFKAWGFGDNSVALYGYEPGGHSQTYSDYIKSTKNHKSFTKRGIFVGGLRSHDYSLAVDDDGDIYYFDFFNNSFALVKIHNGSRVWYNELPNSSSQPRVIYFSDRNVLIAACQLYQKNAIQINMYNKQGVISENTIEGSYFDIRGIMPSSDGNYFISGYGWDQMLAKFTSSGSLISQKRYVGKNNGYNQIATTPDNCCWVMNEKVIEKYDSNLNLIKTIDADTYYHSLAIDTEYNLYCEYYDKVDKRDGITGELIWTFALDYRAHTNIMINRNNQIAVGISKKDNINGLPQCFQIYDMQ